MNEMDPNGRIIRRRLRLSKLDFEMVFKKGKKNTKDDALLRLNTFGETKEDIGEYIGCLLIKDSLLQSKFDNIFVIEQENDSGNEGDEEVTDDYGVCDELLAFKGGALDPVDQFEAFISEE